MDTNHTISNGTVDLFPSFGKYRSGFHGTGTRTGPIPSLGSRSDSMTWNRNQIYFPFLGNRSGSMEPEPEPEKVIPQNGKHVARFGLPVSQNVIFDMEPNTCFPRHIFCHPDIPSIPKFRWVV